MIFKIIVKGYKQHNNFCINIKCVCVCKIAKLLL